MSSIYNIFNIGKHGMMAQQKAIQVTAHNLANVNTEGYSRQEVILEEGMPLNSSPGQSGTGVNATVIRRKYDSFLEGQLTDSRETLGNLDVQKNAISSIESLFYESTGTGINELLSKFFNSLHDLSANPAGTAERISIIANADALSDAVNSVYLRLEQLQKDMNAQVRNMVNDINNISSQIASINVEIARAEVNGQNANDFRDMRGRLLNELAEKIDIKYFEDNSGQITVIGGGMATLVETGNSWELDTKSNPDNYGYYDIVYSPNNNNILNLTGSISNGRLKGFLSVRDGETWEAMSELDRLTASIARSVNEVHRAGYGLDGSTGIDIFSPSFKAGDVLSQDVGSVKALKNAGTGSMTITIDDPAALKFNNYELLFSSGNYTIVNKSTNASSTAVYSGSSSFTFEGLSVTISGSFADGDKYSISAHANTAKNIRVALDMSETSKIAAAAAATSDSRGDNRNSLALAQLQDRLTIDGNSSFSSYYGSIVGRIGVKSQYINNQYAAQEFSSEQLHNMRESVSGVSIDEEMANLMKYQHAYEASARLIRIGDELLETLLGILR